MTTLSPPSQPHIIIRQRRQKARRDAHARRGPKRRVLHRHHAAREMPVHGILGCLHGDHGDEAHARRGAECRAQRELVGTVLQEHGFEEDGGRDTACHWFRQLVLIS